MGRVPYHLSDTFNFNFNLIDPHFKEPGRKQQLPLHCPQSFEITIVRQMFIITLVH